MSDAEFIPISMPDVSGREREYVVRCIETGWVSSIGEFVERFERDFAAYTETSHGISVNSGTAALHLALRAIGVGPGDEVVVPALTFASTANAVLYLGATPVLADSEPGTWNVDPDDVESLVTPRTAALMPVHLYGRPCDMDRIVAVAARHGVTVIEDAAEAHGATYHGRAAGSMGRIGCFSFYGNKMITTGEGGMCVTADDDLAARMRFLRDHGMSKSRRYWHDDVGYNYRITNLQAAIGCAQLERIDEFVARRRWIRDRYAERLAGLGLELPGEDAQARNAFWLYSVLLPPGRTETDRDALIAHLRGRGIDSRPVFYPIGGMPPYRDFARPTPVADSIAARGLSLPTFFALGEGQIDRITGAMREFLTGA